MAQRCWRTAGAAILAVCLGMVMSVGSWGQVRDRNDGSVGVEGIENFDGKICDKLAHCKYCWNIDNGVWQLAGGPSSFYLPQDEVWAADMMSGAQPGGGADRWADNVDLFFIQTHGSVSDLSYNVAVPGCDLDPTQVRLGKQLEWLAMYSCSVIDLNNVVGQWYDVMQGLHMVLGAYGLVWYGWTLEECGRDFASALKRGRSMSSAWFDGFTDWWACNKLAIVSAEEDATPPFVLDNDGWWGYGSVGHDVPHDNIGYMQWVWIEYKCWWPCGPGCD
jgi:hypothetical protein